MISGFVFDMDGILFDTEKIDRRCLNITAARYNIKDISYFKNNGVGLNNEATRKMYKSKLGEDFPYDEFRNSQRELMKSVIREEGLPVKPGAYMLLEYLKTNRYPVALATSTSKKSVMEHLKEARMEEYFGEIMTGDMVSNSKPHPEIYLTACKKLGINPKESIGIEDSPNGLKAVHAAGMISIMVPDCIEYTEELSQYVTYKFNSLTDVLEALRKKELQ